MRFISFMPEINLSAVVAYDNNVHSFSEHLQSLIDTGAGFIKYMSESANYRNPNHFAAGLSVLKDLLTCIGCNSTMVRVAQLEGAVKGKNTRVRAELVEKLPIELEMLIEKLSNIPRISPVSDKISETLETETATEAERRKSILIIDDAADCLNSAEAVLESQFNVYALMKSDTYEKLLQRVMIDLFILDVEMPGLDGYQVFEGIKKMPAYKKTPIMFLTNHATPGNLKMAMEVGVDSFVRKPFNSNILMTKACQAISEAEPRIYCIEQKR